MASMASAIRSGRSSSNEVPRQTYPAPLTATVAQMSSGRSRLPPGVVEVNAPVGVVVECWPPVMPKLKLLKSEHGDPDVAPGGVEQVGAADAGAAVAHDHDDVEVGAGELDAGGVGDAAPVEAVEGAGDEVLVGEARCSRCR